MPFCTIIRGALKLLDAHLSGTVYVAAWLEGRGITRDLQKHYRRSGWLESVGAGALKRPREQVTWQGGLYVSSYSLTLPKELVSL